MKLKNPNKRMLIELPITIHKIFKEEALYRRMTLRKLMIEAFIEKIKRDSIRKEKRNTKKDYKNTEYNRFVLVIPTRLHTVIKSQAVLGNRTLKDYITTALIEKMKDDSKYRENPIKTRVKK